MSIDHEHREAALLGVVELAVFLIAFKIVISAALTSGAYPLVLLTIPLMILFRIIFGMTIVEFK